jgi:hypothetical protein
LGLEIRYTKSRVLHLGQKEDARRIGSSRMKDVIILIQSFLLLLLPISCCLSMFVWDMNCMHVILERLLHMCDYITTSYIYVLSETISICGYYMNHYKYFGCCITWPRKQCNIQNIASLVPNSSADDEPCYHHRRIRWHGTARHQINETVAWSRMPPNRTKWWRAGPLLEHTIWWRKKRATPQAFGIMVASKTTPPLCIE